MGMDRVKRCRGVIVPMITPFTEEGKIDLDAAGRVAEYLVEGGTKVFLLGTTGESASIPDSEKIPLVKAVLDKVGDRSPVYAGISGNCFATSVDLANRYFDMGIEAVVAHLPHYYPLTPEHMLRYYEALADAISGPLILYNIPSTTHISIPLEVIEKLSYHPKIIGLKDSEGDVARLERSLEMWRDREDFSHLVGSSPLSFRGLSLGSSGIVPSGGNVVPHMYSRLYQAAVSGDLRRAESLQRETDEITGIYARGRGLTQSLAALKVMMSELGLCKPWVLPPILPLSGKEREKIREEMIRFGLIKFPSYYIERGIIGDSR
ncbi:TPA: dihydrodipicolinate synthase family protein [Candidatus Poribacteria bacterium]|nr:dihydrodipicolinate synthase family protein [Candidatus Poribacteria bacterium]HEX29414.1 dihydrodipicolinate synthase family protein [Candidatus Poribacteria bacterium]